MDKSRLQELAGVPLKEKHEGLSPEELYHEIMAQYKNLEVYKPQNMEELHKYGGAIIGSARDLISAVQRMIESHEVR